MVAGPGVTPDTVPLVPTVAIVTGELLHVPPEDVSVSTVVAPWQTVDAPPITAGCGFTVTVAVRIQPVELRVKSMMDVPLDTPLTTPVLPIVATDNELLLHVPDPEGSVSEVVPPTHTTGVPLINDGKGFTVTTTVAVHPAPSE